MRLGTRSLLFGCHQIFIHFIFTLLGWIKLYGWKTLDPRMILVLFIHDFGYFGCKEMDGDGLWHPVWTPHLIGKLIILVRAIPYVREITHHSRHLCREHGWTPSRLCWADKLGTGLMPSILWALLAYLSGEGWEYMDNIAGHDYVAGEDRSLLGLRRFHKKYKALWGRREHYEPII